MFLYLLSWLSTFMHIVFITLCLASGLYYLAELIEEYTVITAKVLKYLLIGTSGVFVGLLLFEHMPWYMILLGLFSNGVYSFILKDFPFISLLSPPFLTGCVLVLVNHYFAFQYFGENYYPFSEVLAYFTVCLWLVPFALFVSLSINELILPTITTTQPVNVVGMDGGQLVASPNRRSGKLFGLVGLFSSKKEDILPRSKKF